MLTYSFEKINVPLYEHIYKCIRNDIVSARLKAGEKLPSKRTFAENNGVSLITVQNAYEQLIDEGYVYAIPKKGYYVASLGDMPAAAKVCAAKTADSGSWSLKNVQEALSKEGKEADGIAAAGRVSAGQLIDLSDNRTDPSHFPFSVWAGMMRSVISDMSTELMTPAPTGGVYALRSAIAEHLRSFRGIEIEPERIIVGAGTEYLYGLIIQLMGKDRLYCIENPGYKKLSKIYAGYGIECRCADMDEKGICIKELYSSDADIAHISPTHHFPTGISMPAARRYEVLGWAAGADERYIIEDDYDSEFRQNGKPVPPLISMDTADKVIYMNTFSKSLSPTIRISYMVLPERLTKLFYERLGFYSCTVSNFEQYTLAEFISRGYFEKHINRMRLYYRRQRKMILEQLAKSSLHEKCRVIENASGLHFILEIDTIKSDEQIKRELSERGISIRALTDYYLEHAPGDLHRFLINYSNIDAARLKKALNALYALL